MPCGKCVSLSDRVAAFWVTFCLTHLIESAE